jgi:hypothetical protein
LNPRQVGLIVFGQLYEEIQKDHRAPPSMYHRLISPRIREWRYFPYSVIVFFWNPVLHPKTLGFRHLELKTMSDENHSEGYSRNLL